MIWVVAAGKVSYLITVIQVAGLQVAELWLCWTIDNIWWGFEVARTGVMKFFLRRTFLLDRQMEQFGICIRIQILAELLMLN